MELQKPYAYQNGYIGHGLESALFAQFPKTVEVEGYKLTKKSEFHVSLICVKEYAPRLVQEKGIELEEAERGLLRSFAQFVEKTPVTLNRFENEFRLVEQRERRSVVILCTMKNLEELFAEINKTCGLDAPVQPTHVTLYTLQPNVGIGISSEEGMNKTKRVRLPELQTAFKTL